MGQAPFPLRATNPRAPPEMGGGASPADCRDGHAGRDDQRGGQETPPTRIPVLSRNRADRWRGCSLANGP